jgi:RHS repeat-associated protein
MVVNAAGAIENESDYYPWGGELKISAADSGNHYKFTAKERDAETGLDYFGARYYSNGLGKFATPDWAAQPSPVPYAELVDPQTLNLYSYVKNGPTSRVDPLGHDWFYVDKKWQWQKGHKFVDPNTHKVRSTHGYKYLLRFDPTKTQSGTTTGKLTLFDQNKEIAHSTAFTGGAEGYPRIPAGGYMIRLDLPRTTLGTEDLRVENGRLALKPSYGVQDIPKEIGNGVEAQPLWGTRRAYLNPMSGQSDQAFQGQYLHGKGDPNIADTHGCLADRSEHMMDEILKLGAVHLPVDVH